MPHGKRDDASAVRRAVSLASDLSGLVGPVPIGVILMLAAGATITFEAVANAPWWLLILFLIGMASALCGALLRFGPAWLRRKRVRLADELQRANSKLTAWLQSQAARAHGRTPQLNLRSEIGSDKHADETLARYLDKWGPKVSALMERAQKMRCASRADIGLARRPQSVDDLWVLSSRSDQAKRRLLDEQAPVVAQTIDEWIALQIDVGEHVIRALNDGVGPDGLLLQLDKTPYQAFREWWIETHGLLNEYDARERQELRRDVPGRYASQEEMKAFIGRTRGVLESWREGVEMYCEADAP